MKIRLKKLLDMGGEYELTIRSLDLALYQAEVTLAGVDRLLCDDCDKPLRFRTLQAAREALAPLTARRLQLVHQSAYDEMIGQPGRSQPNTLAVPLAPLKPAHATD